jgi:hypothetical protein
MTLRNSVRFFLLMATCALAAGCSRNTTLSPWPLTTDPVVFTDTFGSHVIWQAFGGSKLDALSLDATTAHSGTSSLKLSVPAAGSYAGGAFTTDRPRNLTGYNAISFWAKASRAVVLDVAGLGNDNTGTSKYTAQRANIALTTDWVQYYIAIPNPARLASEGGMFFVSEGPKAGSAFTFWLDDIQFVNIATITNPRPALTPQTITGIAGSALSLEGATKTVFAVSGLDQTIAHMAGYFDFQSSDLTVATPIAGGVQVIGGGTATITAQLAGVNATGAVTVNATLPPATIATAPTYAANTVISLFGSTYAPVPVDTWSASWDQADSATVRIAGNHLTKRYTKLVYAGIEFTSHPIDASTMTAFHLDVWAPSGATFKVKLVDFGADGVFAGSDNSESELTFTAGTTPPFSSGAWVPLDIPMSAFTTLTARGHLAQLILSSPDVSTVYVDNVLFHQ